MSSDITVSHRTQKIVVNPESKTVSVVRAGPTGPAGPPGAGSADPLILAGDIEIPGEIKTGTYGSPPTFGGIEREARFWAGGSIVSPTAVMNFSGGFPRLNLPAGTRTDTYTCIEIEEWWLVHTLGIYFEWMNDHSANGDVRWDCEIKELDIATEAIGDADVLLAHAQTVSTLNPDIMHTTIFGNVATSRPIQPNPGTYAATYSLRISRLGNHVDDTLDGPVGLFASNMTRGQ